MADETDRGDKDRGDEERRTPIPVREIVPDRKPEPVRRREVEPREIPEVTVPFQVEGERWVARESGVTRSGTSPDSGAPVLLVTFHRVLPSDSDTAAAAASDSGSSGDDPGGAGSADEEDEAPEYGEPLREALAVAFTLTDLSALQVRELFQRSRPFRPTARDE